MQPLCSQQYRRPLTIPTIIPTAYKAGPTATRGCVISQATSSARLRPPAQFRFVERTLDLHTDRTDRSRAADDPIRYGDRSGTNRRLEVGQSVSALPGYFRHQPVPPAHNPQRHSVGCIGRANEMIEQEGHVCSWHFYIGSLAEPEGFEPSIITIDFASQITD